MFSLQYYTLIIGGNLCLPGRFGHDCSLTCSHCENGGRCNRDLTGCECPSGYKGIICEEQCPKVKEII